MFFWVVIGIIAVNLNSFVAAQYESTPTPSHSTPINVQEHANEEEQQPVFAYKSDNTIPAQSYNLPNIFSNFPAVRSPFSLVPDALRHFSKQPLLYHRHPLFTPNTQNYNNPLGSLRLPSLQPIQPYYPTVPNYPNVPMSYPAPNYPDDSYKSQFPPYHSDCSPYTPSPLNNYKLGFPFNEKPYYARSIYQTPYYKEKSPPLYQLPAIV